MTTLTERSTVTDFLRIADLTSAQVKQLLDLAAQMKAAPHAWVDTLRGRSLACFFEKPSTRTRVSFAAAAYRLGMLPIMLRPDELQLGRGEPIADTARVL
ncbi:MAG TPA: ornithine carbamoyltransferase, partial [Roseiflexaceae bacterium]|nr:ornithine carbamoyltransferase [Roseiflexaceae bacterium]